MFAINFSPDLLMEDGEEMKEEKLEGKAGLKEEKKWRETLFKVDCYRELTFCLKSFCCPLSLPLTHSLEESNYNKKVKNERKKMKKKKKWTHTIVTWG